MLARHQLTQTGPVDHADWNHRTLVGWVSRQRFRLVSQLMGDRRCNDLLELGYGSGIFAPHLSMFCESYHGVDVHHMPDAVGEVLATEGIEADLSVGAAEDLPLADETIDWIVAISVLEFVDDIDAVCEEMARVLRGGGSVFAVTPGSSPILDLALKLGTGESASDDFGDRRELVEPALRRHFEVVDSASFPTVNAFGNQVYRAFELQAP